METIIKNQDGYDLIISDADLDSASFVQITLRDNDSAQIVTGDFLITDLMPALIAFDAKRSRRLEEESS